MPEIVHLSFGPRANYLNTCFYNDQESYFVYSDREIQDSLVDPSPRFKAGKEFTPRALFWDLNGGFGSLERISSVYENKDSPEYQQIKAGYSSDQSWTDTLRVKLHPKYRQELQNWHVDESGLDGKAKGSEQHHFLAFGEGKDEFETLGDEYVDDFVRPLFEVCDNLAGINLCTDFSGWAGFTDPVLQALRDDYVPKTTIVSWALAENTKYPRTRHYSILETYLSLTQYSDLVVPLATNSGDPWQRAQQQNIVFETVGLLSSLRSNRVSMSTLVNDLTSSSTDCNIVQAKATTQVQTNDFFIPFKTEVYDARMDLAKRDSAHPAKIKEAVVIDRPKKLELKLPTEDAIVYECAQPARDYDSIRAELALTNDPLELRKLIRPWEHELKERVHEMTEPYIWGYDSDSDFE